MSERIEVDGAKPADSGRVTDEVVTRACNAYFDALPPSGGVAADREAMRAAITAALAAQGQGESECCMHGCYCGCCRACKNGSCEPVKYAACDCITSTTPASPAGVPDATDLEQLKKAMEDWNDGVDTDVPQHALMRLAELKLLVAETFEVTKKGMDLLANAPSAPESNT